MITNVNDDVSHLLVNIDDVVLLSPDSWFFFPMFLRSCALMVRVRVCQFHVLFCTISMCLVLWLFITGRSMSPPSGPVCIPTVDGWYQSLQLFHPAYLDGCDIELGHDWLASVSPTYVAPQFSQLATS
jgi:hypothetical protein